MTDLKKLSTPELWTLFRAKYRALASNIKTLAEIWWELVERGEDMSVWHSSFTLHFPEVATGALHPAALMRFGGQREAINLIKQMVLTDQERFANAVTIDLLEMGGNVRKAKPAGLRIEQLRQVISPEGIRTPKQQEKHVSRPAVMPPVKAPQPTPNESALFTLLGLTPGQRDDLTAAADAKRMTAAEFLVDMAVRAGAIRKATPVVTHRRVRSSHTS